MEREHELDLETSEYRRHKKRLHGSARPGEELDDLEDDDYSTSDYDDEEDYDFYANSSEEDLLMAEEDAIDDMMVDEYGDDYYADKPLKERK